LIIEIQTIGDEFFNIDFSRTLERASAARAEAFATVSTTVISAPIIAAIFAVPVGRAATLVTAFAAPRLWRTRRAILAARALLALFRRLGL
jgi:hypothetical protein